ncbi:TATA element modulatory factor [Cyphellophora attinorum]|uniref:TATA element modulatory factor n=1 Tax=Cyphellophora attinorum TaxID=1664694 RepID=A0A0N1NY19_9EURO|nr:TATA element modulatory factor [Phialophora attinorum]KPI39086.1 TATA element modulatory factor [Phialophora attinorum]
MAKKNASRPESPLPPPMDSQEKENIEPVGTSAQETQPADINLLPEESERHVQPNLSAVPSLRASAESQSVVHPSDLHSHLEAEAARQKLSDELTEHKERIDSLQAKLRTLSTQAARAAEGAVAAAEAGSTDKKLAEKEKGYALLTEEWTSLQKKEMTLRQTIKRMTDQARISEKSQADTKQRAEKAERNLRIMEDRARKAEAVAKRSEQSLAASASASYSIEAVTKERDALSRTLADIRAQLSRANQRAEAAESKATSEQLDKERTRTAELQDDLTSARVERELAEEKLRREIKDLTASLEREKEHSRAMETEMLGEQAALESKLESFRARAEEASSSDQGDVQAKLLRQIETLQSQYAAASQNWQGIESSLLARITHLEKERDEVANRETDVRRKLRESTSKLKRTERDLEDAQNRLPETEKLLGEAEEEGRRHQRKIGLLKDELIQTRQERDDQEVQHERDFKQRLEEERAKWAASAIQPARTESPVTSLRKGGLGIMPTDPFERRRSSVYPYLDTSSRQHSVNSLKGLTNGGATAVPETPSIMTSHDPDEYFNNVPPTPASQSHANSPRAVHDLVSTSTVGAGPSVQLVERMSANVRRLESEKAASRDEIARLTTQRDESRREVVELMREMDEKRDVATRLANLEAENAGLAKRHQTTLELLGEKSEQVEELQADILDVKQMYRQLADTMGKS